MFKTSDRASFLIIFFLLLQYYVFVVLSGDIFFTFSARTFIATPSPEQKIAYQTFFALKVFFGNYWSSAMFGGPDFFANLSDWLKIIDPIFITCDDIG